MKTLPHLAHRHQSGVALIASLIILVLMTLVAVSVFRNNILAEKITADVREKQRALEIANNALAYGEWWLKNQSASNPSNLVPVACNTTGGGTTATLRVCTTAAGRTSASIANFQMYDGYRPGINIQTGGGVVSNGDVYYTQYPGIWISTVGTNYANPGQTLYQVTAVGYGGNSLTQAVVQSLYTIPIGGSGGGGSSGTSGATPGVSLGGA